LECQVGQFIQPRRVGLGLIRNERSAQFEEDEFGHGSVLPQIHPQILQITQICLLRFNSLVQQID